MTEQNIRRFPPPWTVEQIPGGYKVVDANGQSLAYVYGRETKADADIAHVLTMDEARRRTAANIRQAACAECNQAVEREPGTSTPKGCTQQA